MSIHVSCPRAGPARELAAYSLKVRKEIKRRRRNGDTAVELAELLSTPVLCPRAAPARELSAGSLGSKARIAESHMDKRGL